MLPAHERLEAGDAAAAELHDRLVAHDELAALQAELELGLELHAPGHGLVHRGREELEVARALALGLVHGQVGVAQQPLRALADVAGPAAVVDGDADASRG